MISEKIIEVLMLRNCSDAQDQKSQFTVPTSKNLEMMDKEMHENTNLLSYITDCRSEIRYLPKIPQFRSVTVCTDIIHTFRCLSMDVC